MRLVLRLALAATCLAAGACSPAAAPSPSVPPLSTGSADASSRPTTVPRPSASPVAPSPEPASSSVPPAASGVRPWPADFGQPLEQSRYQASPPFAEPFTLAIDGPGWVSGHIGPEFIDVQRFDGRTLSQLPTRLVGFALPGTVRGTTDVPVEGLAPAEAIDLLEDRDDLTASGRSDVELFGSDGVRVDLHATASNTPLFGGPGGTFGLGPQQDVRLSAVVVDRRLWLVLVMADPGQLDAAWEDALPILESVESGRS